MTKNQTIRHTLLATCLLALPFFTWAGGKPIAAEMPKMTPELKARLAKADLAAAERFFERKCSQCHDSAKTGGNFKGPHLWNWFGRKAGTFPGFDYSPAMKASAHEWNYATLDHYLADTEIAVPGRSMNFTGIDDPDLRASVVAYMRQFNDKAPPLPK